MDGRNENLASEFPSNMGTGKIDIKALQIKLFTGPKGTTVTSLLPGRVPVFPSQKQPVVKLLAPDPQNPDTHLLHVQTYDEENVLSSMCKRRPKKASGARPPSREFVRRLGSNSDDNVTFDVGVEISNPDVTRRIENEEVSKEHVINIRTPSAFKHPTPSSFKHPPAVKCTDENEAVIEVHTNTMPNTTQGQKDTRTQGHNDTGNVKRFHSLSDLQQGRQKLRRDTNDDDRGNVTKFHSFTDVQLSRSNEQTGIVRSQTQHRRNTMGNNNWVSDKKGEKSVPPSVTPKPSSHVLKNRTREASTPPSNRGNNTHDSRNVSHKEVAKPAQLETGRETGKTLLQGKAARRIPDRPSVDEVDKGSIKTTGVQLKLKSPTEQKTTRNEQSENSRFPSNKSELHTVLKTGIPQTQVLRPVNQKTNVKEDSDNSIKGTNELASKFQKLQKKNNEMTSSIEQLPSSDQKVQSSRRLEIIPVKKYQQIETSNYFNYKKSNDQGDVKTDSYNENQVSSSQKRDKGKTNVTYVPYAGSSENLYMNMNPFTGVPKRTSNVPQTYPKRTPNESEQSKERGHVARMRSNILTKTDSSGGTKSSIPKASFR